EDATPPQGTYRLEVRKTSDSSLVYTVDGVNPGDPSILQDKVFAENTAYTVNVIELTGSPTPRNFKLRVSPRYTDPPVATINFDTTTAGSLAAGDFDTYKFTVGGGNLGLTDIYLRDNGISLGNNSVTVIGPDRVTTLASVSAQDHVSVDASEQ